MPKPTCKNEGHENSVLLCQVIEPDTLVTGVKFYMCAHDGSGGLWDDEGTLIERQS